MMSSKARWPSRQTRILLAFATVYLVWGSTYLAIRVGVQELPAVLFAGVRFLIAAPLMLAFAWLMGDRLPRNRRDWLVITFTALAMLVGANGLVTWSEQWVESNQAALIIATSALWMAGLGSLGSAGERPAKLAMLGLLLGLLGVAVLVGSGFSSGHAPLSAYLALLISPLLWAAGSVYARRHPLSCSPWMASALQMGVTGVVMTTLGLLRGEAGQWIPTAPALAALFYLALFGSCVAYGAYHWLVHEVTPAQLGTYAYVNPAVAVLLGAWLLDERLQAMQWLGTLAILGGVLLVTLDASRLARRAS